MISQERQENQKRTTDFKWSFLDLRECHGRVNATFKCCVCYSNCLTDDFIPNQITLIFSLTGIKSIHFLLVLPKLRFTIFWSFQIIKFYRKPFGIRSYKQTCIFRSLALTEIKRGTDIKAYYDRVNLDRRSGIGRSHMAVVVICDRDVTSVWDRSGYATQIQYKHK